MDGDLTSTEIVAWGPNDFLNEVEKLKRLKAEELNAAMKRGDWAREHRKTKMVGFFKCGKCKSMNTDFY